MAPASVDLIKVPLTPTATAVFASSICASLYLCAVGNGAWNAKGIFWACKLLLKKNMAESRNDNSSEILMVLKLMLEVVKINVYYLKNNIGDGYI